MHNLPNWLIEQFSRNLYLIFINFLITGCGADWPIDGHDYPDDNFNAEAGMAHDPSKASPIDAGVPQNDSQIGHPAQWVLIPPGTFLMGSPENENCRESDETPHLVTLRRAFEISTTEVTQGQFASLMGYNPSFFMDCGEDCPVEQVSWYEAAAYCNELSKADDYEQCYECTGNRPIANCTLSAKYQGSNIYLCPGYRLPTEAEWEYAYRANSTSALYNNNSINNCLSNDENANTISWNYYNSSFTTHPVGQKTANQWGLYDMAGNVWEWTNDGWDGAYADSNSAIDPAGQDLATYRIWRGGSWLNEPAYVRAANRGYGTPAYNYDKAGFRCVRGDGVNFVN